MAPRLTPEAVRKEIRSIMEWIAECQEKLRVLREEYPDCFAEPELASKATCATRAPQATPKKVPALKAKPVAMDVALPAPQATKPKARAINTASEAPASSETPVKAPQAATSASPPPKPSSIETSASASVLSIESGDSMDVPEPELDSDPESSASSDDGFTVVLGGKRKRSDKPSAKAPPAKAAAVPRADPRLASQATRAPQASSSSSPSQPSAKKEKSPPPIFLRQKEKWDKVAIACRMRNIAYTHAKSVKDGIKVQVTTSDDHRALTKFLRAEDIGYHTYALEDEKVLRVVIRGLPVEQTPESIKADLLAQNYPVREVHRMFSGRTKVPYEMVLVILDLSPAGKAIFNLRTVNNLSGLSVEAPYRKSNLSQCHRCQLYGHSARNCHARPRCVKCLGDHGTPDCSRTPGAPEPPSCVLCGAEGHTANYRGCPKAPKGASKRVAQRQPERYPPTPQYSRATPKVTLAPPRPPAYNAWRNPLPGTSLGSQAKASPPPKPTSAPKANPPTAQTPAGHTEMVNTILASLRLLLTPEFLSAALQTPNSPHSKHP